MLEPEKLKDSCKWSILFSMLILLENLPQDLRFGWLTLEVTDLLHLLTDQLHRIVVFLVTLFAVLSPTHVRAVTLHITHGPTSLL
jgi:hypothetical protein